MFSFGGSSSRSRSSSNARSYVDPAQQPHLNNIRNQAMMLTQGGMPVEGVAGINPALDTALGNRFNAGAGQIKTGQDMSVKGGMMRAHGNQVAMDAASRAAGSGFDFGQTGMNLNQGAGNFAMGGQQAMASTGQGLNYNTMQGLAGAGERMGFAQQNGINPNTATGIAGMARMGNATLGNAQMQNGINADVANQIGGMANMTTAAQGRGIDTQTAGQARGMVTNAGAAQNQGFTQANLGNYINNDVLNSQIDSASRDVVRNLQENQLTGNASNAAASGNSGSSRRAVMDAIATRGAADRIGDISANMRGQAYNQAMGIEANRASQNAGFNQQTNLANASAANQLASTGLNIAAQQGQQNVGNQQQTNLANQASGNQFQSQGVGVAANQAAANQGAANQFGLANMNAMNAQGMANQNAYNAALNQGVGVAANQSSQNAANRQESFRTNAQQYNQLLGQGANIGASQLAGNLDRLTNTSQFNAGQFNNLFGQGGNLSQSMFGLNQNNNQFGANLAANLGAQGSRDMMSGAQLENMGLANQQGAGQYLRDFEQQLLAMQYQQGMAPYNALNFYNQMVGAPTVLNEAESESSGKSRSANFGFG